MTELLLSMERIRKRFGPVVALAGVDLEVGRGEVHALVGENGAGKSTLMKVLSGAHAPDDGRMTLDGVAYAPRRPVDALRAGVAMIYQELNLAPDLTVAQNLVLGRERSRLGVVSADPRVDRALAVLDHPDLAPDRPVRELGPGARQLVEIGRALVGEAKVVVLDEPTSSLSAAESEKLDAVIRALRARDVSIVYISHFLEEVKRIADRYTVLRDGETVATGRVADTEIAAIVEQMVGRSLGEAYPRVPHEPGEPLLEVSALSGRERPEGASFTLRRGEILGIAGLVGAGRTELLRALMGLDPVRRGRVTIGGDVDGGAGVRRRIAQGLGLVSEDRKEEGLALDRSIAENLTLSRPVARLGWIDRRLRSAVTKKWSARLAIKMDAAEQPVGALSGGNQQKVAIARLLHQEAELLLLDEPTRGIDVGSKVEVYRLIGELAAQGKSVLMVSSYVPELLGVCDRVAVMHRGALGAPRPVSEWTEVEILDEAIRGAA
ncbi:MAG: sugar ABC transporter ATP-binding protein [Myxococcota bacterium]|nr:sugar ABC transporter ATP-binding protein [Myxococcota bacterium]